VTSIASHITDMHVCALFTGPVPHVGGPVIGPGAVTVLASYLPASKMGDMAICVGPPDTLLKGSATVFVTGMPWVRLGIDPTVHGGTVVGPGAPTIIVGG
jgi:uncharacterized Zn-binding protein involved in type VI secretion